MKIFILFFILLFQLTSTTFGQVNGIRCDRSDFDAYGVTREQATTRMCDLFNATYSGGGYDVDWLPATSGCGCLYPDPTSTVYTSTQSPIRAAIVCVNGRGVAGPADADGMCPSDKDNGDNCNLVGGPCNVATGNKYKAQPDMTTGPLGFTRYYNSNNLDNVGLGAGWRNNYQPSLEIIDALSVVKVDSDGRSEPWDKLDGVWLGDPDSKTILTESNTGFVITKADGQIENYSQDGQLLSSIESNGQQTTYSYDNLSQLEQVTNEYGQSILMSYVNGNLKTVTDTLGNIYTYEYDAYDNLATVIYPDTTPNDNTDNPRVTYHYQNIDYPNHLTGITDENGDRFETYAYDTDGKASSTEQAQTTNPVGQEKFEFDYQGAN